MHWNCSRFQEVQMQIRTSKSERWFCAFATTIVTAPLDPERSPLRGVQPSAIKIQFAKGPQWIHDKHGVVGWIVMMLMAMITYHDLRLDYFVFW